MANSVRWYGIYYKDDDILRRALEFEVEGQWMK